MSEARTQWVRKVSLLLVQGEEALDVSAFRIRFSTQNADVESPNSCAIRVYNLSKELVNRIGMKGEFSRVVLSAGYEGGNFGIIFKGDIKQFKIGRENATDSYLDIFASDGDIGYNQGIVNGNLAKGATNLDKIFAIAKAFPDMGLDIGALAVTRQYMPSIRGSVFIGMARARMREVTTYLDAGWSISDGVIVVTDNTGYRDGEAVVINVATGLIGVPEQTDSGIRVRCLLNSKIRIGGRIKLNNDEISRLYQQNPEMAPIPANQWTGFQLVAGLSDKGFYRTFVVEHDGDTRGNEWTTTLTCLTVNETAGDPNKSVQEDQ